MKICAICGKSFPDRNIISGEIIRKEIADQVVKKIPEWSAEKFICRTDLTGFLSKYVRSLIESEKGEPSSLELEFVHSLREHEPLSSDLEAQLEQKWTFGERLTDKIATFEGSWTFLICFGVFLLFWIGTNTLVVIWRSIDPHPFFFLNLLLSCLAAIQAPIIMMSQNHQETKNRIRSQLDY